MEPSLIAQLTALVPFFKDLEASGVLVLLLGWGILQIDRRNRTERNESLTRHKDELAEVSNSRKEEVGRLTDMLTKEREHSNAMFRMTHETNIDIIRNNTEAINRLEAAVSALAKSHR